MKEQARILKNQRIKESISLTNEKRKNQICSVYQVKIQENKLTKKQKEHLKMLFVEAKWIINSVLNFSNENKNNKIWDYKLKTNKVNVFDKNKNLVEKELNYISSQMKQSVVAEMIANIRTLSSLKKNGIKVGKLKYRKECKSINLKQYHNTYKFVSNNKMKIQGVPGRVLVNGLDQFINDKDIEFANAKILNTPNGYYIAITTYKNKEKIKKKELLDEKIGIDFGVKNNLTLSNGKKINVSVEESERLKKLQKKLSRQEKSSNNRKKTVNLLRKEYQTIKNKKQDAANKIVSELLKYKTIYIQDENLIGWKENGFGKQVHHSILGRVKQKLKNNKEQVVIVDRYKPTTKCCSRCLNVKEEMSLGERKYVCESCGFIEDRDLNSAKNMILFGNKLVPAERREVKPVEKTVGFSLKQEAPKL
ncbi:MAG TPA: transposase [Leptospiraceae bacterium]|nr:transposase [Leptospiraceae bacterium]